MVQDASARGMSPADDSSLDEEVVRLRRRCAALEAELADLQTLLETVPAGVALLARDGTMVRVNGEFRRIWGGGAADIPMAGSVEETADYVGFDPGSRERLRPDEWASTRALTRGETTLGETVEIRRFDGEPAVILNNARPLLDDTGGVRGAVVAVLDISDRERAEQARREGEEALRDSEALLRQVLEHSRDGINLLDLDSGRYVYMNPAQVALTGFTAEELSGMTATEAYDRVHPEDVHLSIEQQQAVAAGRDPATVEYRWRVKSGEYRWFSDSRGLIRDGDGRPVALVGVSRDITDRRRAEEAQREADRAKSEFLAVLSHELRNPLTPIRNSLHVLERAPEGGEAAQRARMVIARQVDQLARLVDDLLDATRLDRSKVVLRRRPVELLALLRDVLADHRSLLERAGLAVEEQLPEGPLWLEADRERVAQVAANLLHNAAKFTPRGGRVTVTAAGEPADVVRFAVEDTGVGIDPMLLPRLFAPFMQIDETIDRARGGLGLGLSLVRGLVELHGGTVSAHSDGLGRGSRFEVRLPGLSGPPGEVTASRAPRPRDCLRVLVIDDSHDAADTLREVLTLFGHAISVAYSGTEGLRVARAERPDVVLCDIGLPDLDGYEVARAFRADPALREIPLVALSGYALPDDLRRSTEAGFTRHLAKPPDLEVLADVITALAAARARLAPGGVR